MPLQQIGLSSRHINFHTSLPVGHTTRQQTRSTFHIYDVWLYAEQFCFVLHNYLGTSGGSFLSFFDSDWKFIADRRIWYIISFRSHQTYSIVFLPNRFDKTAEVKVVLYESSIFFASYCGNKLSFHHQSQFVGIYDLRTCFWSKISQVASQVFHQSVIQFM